MSCANPQISIVIVNWNTRERIRRCLGSLERCLEHPERYEVVVVDNGSRDGSTEMIRTQFKRVRVIENSKNLGFSLASNQGARESCGEFLFFMNPDSILLNHVVLNRMYEFAKSNEQCGVVGARILNSDGSIQPKSGRFPTLFRIIIDRLPLLDKIIDGVEIRRKSFYTAAREVDWTGGGAFLINRGLFEALNGFDESYFLYFEDIDLCYSLHRMGYKHYLLPEAVIMHDDQGIHDSSRRPPRYYHLRRGANLFLKRYRSRWTTVIFSALMRVEASLRLSYYLLNPFLVRQERQMWIDYIKKTLTMQA